MKDLSIVVPSYNTSEITEKALDAVQKSLLKTPNLTYEIIVVDNNSSDESPEMLKKYRSLSGSGEIHIILNKENVGFGRANNMGFKQAKGEFILLLNSDLIADNVNFSNLVEYLRKNSDIGGLTVRVELPSGKIDPASHRGFPTVWRSISYFTKLQKLTHHVPFVNKIFGGYHLTYMNLNTIHDIDSPTAAFFLTRKEILDMLGGFDEDYFMYGEDIDLAMRMKKMGFRIVYYPLYTVIHLKHQSGLKSKKKRQASPTTFHFYDAMKIFYDKHYAPTTFSVTNTLVHKAIDFKYWLHKRGL